MNYPTVVLVTGRVGLASLFLLGGLNKILNYDSTLLSMREAGLEPAGFLLPLVIVLELVGGSFVAVGNRMAGMAALLLAGFTIATNFAFHEFWAMEGERAALELSLFFKNISIAGALIFVAGTMLKEKSKS